MTDLAVRRARPVRRASRPARLALVLSLVVVLAGAAVFARAWTLQDSVLPGVSVAGVDVGGLSRADARARIGEDLGARLARPVTVSVGGGSFDVAPAEVWALDAAATGERAFHAGRGSLVSRLGALVAPFAFEHEVEPVLELRPAERTAVAGALHDLTRRPVNAKLRVKGTEVVVRPGENGTAVEAGGLLASVQSAALAGEGAVTARVESVEPAVTTAAAERVASEARTVLAAPIAVRLEGRKVGRLTPAQLAPLVLFERAAGTYEVTLDVEGVERALAPMIQERTRRPVDASFRVAGDRVRVVPAKPGTTLAPRKARNALLAAGRGPGPRVAAVTLTALPAAFTTKDARALGIREKITSFTTHMGESSPNRIHNVHLIGDYMDGDVIRPGETYSYNERVGPRTVERGFREGQMIFGGVLIPSIGGGVCQTATTIFNAAFEAGLPIDARVNHSFYIDHYPVGRDATVSWGGPDLVFRNDLKHGILVKTSYTNDTFTVTFYGKKQGRKVEATTSERTAFTQPQLQYAVDPSAPPRSVRRAPGGGPGFDVNVHRTVYEKGKVLREDDFFTRYVPQNPTAIYGPGRTPPGDFFYLPAT